MRYFDRSTKNTPNLYEIRLKHTNYSIPDGADLSFLGYDTFILTEAPTPLPFHRVVEDTPTTNIQVWKQVPFTDDEVISYVVERIQQRLDNFAKTRSYDDIKSLASYAGDSDPIFNAEGTYGRNIRSQTWRKAITMLNEIKAGTRPKPQTYEEFEAELPLLQWP